jgi:thymidylate synthase
MIKNMFHDDVFDVDISQLQLNPTDREYCDLLTYILTEGVWKQNRTGVKTLSVFGPQVVFKNVGERFPLLTQKKIYTRGVIGELLWFLSGSTDKRVLQEKYKTHIWDEWDAPYPQFDGDMGPIYGHQWVNWEYNETVLGSCGVGFETRSINQLQNVIDTLKTNPDDRRMIVSAWKPDQLHEMALPPCHWSYQFYTVQYPEEEERTLHMKMNIRSWDVFLGAPFNIASYATLLMMVAKEVNMRPGDLYISAGDAHLYEDHLPYVREFLKRDSKGQEPTLLINNKKDFWDHEPEDFKLFGYVSHPNWKNVPVAV